MLDWRRSSSFCGQRRSAAARKLGIPQLTQWGLKEDVVDELMDHAQCASSMRGNPVKLAHHPDIGDPPGHATEGKLIWNIY